MEVIGDFPVSTDSLNNLGRAIHRERTRRGLTLRKLAELSAIPAGTVWRLESGLVASPKPEQLAHLARALGIDVEEFYAAAGLVGLSGLPELRPYLRAKYGLGQQAADRVEGYLRSLRDEGKEASDDRDDDA